MSKHQPQLKIRNQFNCPQSFDSMTPVEGGSHCDKCAKTVYDFTKLPDREIAEIMMKNPQGVCARTKVSQMNRNLLPAQAKKARSYWPPLVAGLITAVVPSWASAQTNAPDYTQVWYDKGTPNCALLEEDTLPAQIKGVVIDDESGEPLPFANVYLADHKIGAVTDFDGNFTLKIPDSLRNDDSLSLVISFIGYETKNVLITDFKGELSLTLLTLEMTGDVVIVGSTVSYSGLSKFKVWRKMKYAAWKAFHPKYWFED